MLSIVYFLCVVTTQMDSRTCISGQLVRPQLVRYDSLLMGHMVLFGLLDIRSNIASACSAFW